MSNGVTVTAGSDLVIKKLSHRLAEKFGVEPAQLMETLKATAFRIKDGVVSDSQMIALLVVADQYGLNPFTKEIYAYPDSKTGGIVPVVGVDGWHRIINRGDDFQGIEYEYSTEWSDWKELEGAKPCPDWIEAKIWRKGREKPYIVREYLDECYRPPFKRKDGSLSDGPWQSHTKRMLRHKTTIQCARVGFGFAGIYDEDEAERITANADFEVVETRRSGKPTVSMPKAIGQGKDTPKTGSQDSKPLSSQNEAVKPDTPKTITEADYAKRVGTIISRLHDSGIDVNGFASALVKAGCLADPMRAEEKERAKVLSILYGLLGEVDPNA